MLTTAPRIRVRYSPRADTYAAGRIVRYSELRRILLKRTSENAQKANFREFLFHALRAGGSSVLRGCLEVAQQPALVLPLGLLLLLTAGGLLGLLGDPTHGVLRTLGSLARLLGYLAGSFLRLLERLVYVLCQPQVLSRLI